MSTTEQEILKSTRRWVENWARVAPYLEAERAARLQAMDERASAAIAWDLWSSPTIRPGDRGEGLREMARALAAFGLGR